MAPTTAVMGGGHDHGPSGGSDVRSLLHRPYRRDDSAHQRTGHGALDRARGRATGSAKCRAQAHLREAHLDSSGGRSSAQVEDEKVSYPRHCCVLRHSGRRRSGDGRRDRNHVRPLQDSAGSRRGFIAVRRPGAAGRPVLRRRLPSRLRIRQASRSGFCRLCRESDPRCCPRVGPLNTRAAGRSSASARLEQRRMQHLAFCGSGGMVSASGPTGGSGRSTQGGWEHA